MNTTARAAEHNDRPPPLIEPPKTNTTPTTPWTPEGDHPPTPAVQAPPSIFSPSNLTFKIPEKAFKKRPRDVIEASTATTPPIDPLPKRRRLQPHHRHTLDHFDFPLLKNPSGPNQPPSPLFFSNHRRLRPQLPARLSSSEAGARMLSKTKGEDSQIRTVHLPRGTMTGSSPSGMSNVTRSVSDRTSIPRNSPEVSDKSYDPLRVLGQVGIVELLEQDSRPTFIVDLKDPQNYGAGDLQIVFANAALRADAALLDSVTGKHSSVSPSSKPPDPELHFHFKAWMLSAASSGESLDVCLPSCTYGGVAWSCSTIRKRLRILSASSFSRNSPQQSIVLSSGDVSMSSAPLITDSAVEPLTAVPAPTMQEPQDYFGDAAPPPPDSASTTSHPSQTTYMSAIEPPDPNKPCTMPGWNGRVFNSPQDFTLNLSNNSFTNLCVLGAAAAGNVDAFGISTNNAFCSHLSDGTNAHESPKEVGFFDWTRLPISDALPRHIQFARSIDWTNTKLGPIENWSPDLRQMCNLIMASPHPAAMYWGDDLVAIYNEAYVLLAGQKHPKLMGQSYADAWAEIWDEVKDVFENAKQTGQATMKDDDCLFIKRSDYLEETYFSWSIIPMVGGDGTVMGLYNPAFEKTRRKIAERRMLTLREVGERTATARDVKSFWEQVCLALEANEFDTPFVLLYSVSDDNDSDSSSIHSSSLIGTKQCYLEGALGVPRGHMAAPEQLELKTSMEGFGPVFREVMKTDKPVVLEVGTGDLPQTLLDGLDWRGFGDPCRSVVICPVHPTTGDSATLGFLVMGVNPRRPYDDDYGLYIQLLSRQLATSLASVVLFEEEIRRGQRAAKLAALDRIELSEQLAARTQEAIDSETRFTRMAEFSPAGLFIADSEGHITYCNDTWYEISRVAKNATATDHWIDAVKEDDQDMVHKLWRSLVDETKPITAEFRFKAPWQDRDGNMTNTWVLFSAYPERYTHEQGGGLKSVFGSITNISQQKWAEGFQKRKTMEAVELKRQQENFIDITSHEMRNPLSAILQCADEIVTSLNDWKGSGETTISSELVSSSIDAAQTITLCAQHQKRIVDDVLTLSKLDSAMLLVTPIDVQPITVAQRALKMFEQELQTADIQMRFVVDDSFKQLGINWVRLDPSRVLQVLINLTTNAIKFTTKESKRTITVTIAASLEKPSYTDNRPVDYFPTRNSRPDMTLSPDWGTGEQVYVCFAVQDTGRGLNDEEKKLLFLRFSQASPRTHVQYGGSGLGLFISRELTELQGGEIGVASEAGKGSTFAFYVKARRSIASTDPLEAVLTSGLTRVPSNSARGKPDSAPKTRDFANPGAGSPASGTLEKKDRSMYKVLIVEDNLVNQRVLMKQLKAIGLTVYVANHGGEALDMLCKSTFWHENKDKADVIDLSVVLMDQEMPVMNGLQATTRIRDWENEGKLISHVPIIAVTANARSEQIATLLAAGMDDVVSKPFRIPELTPKIEELSARYGTIREPTPGLQN